MALGAARLVHGTAIGLDGRAALIRGESGAGKSDLALRCLMQPATPLVPGEARLVADDQVLAEVVSGQVRLRCPPPIHGLIEVRGLGVLRVPALEVAELALLVDLVAPGEVERLPDPDASAELLGVRLPRLALCAFEPSAPLKLLLALQGRPGVRQGT